MGGVAEARNVGAKATDLQDRRPAEFVGRSFSSDMGSAAEAHNVGAKATDLQDLQNRRD